MAAARVLAHETSEKERATVENMLEVCGTVLHLMSAVCVYMCECVYVCMCACGYV